MAGDEALLIYGLDTVPGIRRVRAGRGFRYVLPSGKPVEDAETRARIASLVIPPAWEEVWIAPEPRFHVQATGRDARGRKQYRYHDLWEAERTSDKYARIADFGLALPRIRRAVSRHLKLRGLPRERVLALVVALIDATGFRVGNAEYEHANGSRGITTLRAKDAQLTRGRVTFVFTGKGGKQQRATVADRRLARLVRGCEELPGQHLFQFRDDGGDARDITSADVNAYLREISGGDFTAKDFRTWSGSVVALSELASREPPESAAAARRAIAAAMRTVASELGNTPAVCRASYVHPRILEEFEAGTLRTRCAGGGGTLDRPMAERCLRKLLTAKRRRVLRPLAVAP